MILPLLAATVIAIGGPPPHKHHHHKPGIFGNATIRVRDSQHREVAFSRFGNLTLRLPAGSYEVEALLEPPVLNQARSCGERTVTIAPGARARSLWFVCQIR